MYSKFAVYCATVLLVVLPTMVAAVEVQSQLDGTKFNADLVLAESKGRSENIVVIVHGTLGHKDMDVIENLQNTLQEYGYNSLAINLSLNIDDRHGFFSCDTDHTHRVDDALKEIDAWLGWLKPRYGGGVTLMGHSRGANQAAKFALENAEKISRLILLAPSSRNVLISAAEAAMLDGKNDDDWLAGVEFLHCDDTTVQVGTYLSYIGPEARNDTVVLLDGVSVRTLVISGSEDDVVPDLASRMPEVSNKLVRHVEIDGADHFFRDLYAYDVVDAIEIFDESVLAPHGLIEAATSLQDDARSMPASATFFVVFVSQSGCEFCEQLRRQVLYPAIRLDEMDSRIELREVSLDDGFLFEDFQGQTIAGSRFAKKYGAYVTPTLLFLDAQGNSLGEPLIGLGNIEFYGVYLNRKIEAASKALAER